jgi:hypothetical protein
MTGGDIIKIDTTYAIIHGNNKGPMTFDKSAKTNEEKDIGATSKAVNPKYSMPRCCPSGLTQSQTRKLQRLRTKESKEKRQRKCLMIHICSTHHHKRDGDQRPPKQLKRPQRWKMKQQLHNSLQIRRTVRLQQPDHPCT